MDLIKLIQQQAAQDAEKSDKLDTLLKRIRQTSVESLNLSDEKRQGRKSCRHYTREGDVGYYTGANGERFEFPVGEHEQRKLAQQAARKTWEQ